MTIKLEERVSKDEVKRLTDTLTKNYKRLAPAYRGGLAAEAATLEQLSAVYEKALSAAELSTIGRRIDLVALLKESRAEDKPLWALVDPTLTIDQYNGGVTAYGHYQIRQTDTSKVEIIRVGFTRTNSNILTPRKTVPPIPAKARKIFQDREIRDKALWVGLLYQPEEWDAIVPDPAVVVEWKDRPGEYYCLAIWGGDRPRIEEFID